tara:strand:- start:92 stop:448 length:357 start_codon:yes stop_codon:yes gene_type:complete
MRKPIYANEQHKQAIETYLLLCQEFSKDIGTKSKYYNYLDIVDIILEYHNNYGSGLKENNFYDWLMIIPINMSIMTNGFFAGAETKANSAIIRAYKLVLDEMLQDVVVKIEKIEPLDD